MDYKIMRTSEDIDAVLNECSELEDKGKTKFRGMTYEQGVIAMFRWLIGDEDSSPIEE